MKNNKKPRTKELKTAEVLYSVMDSKNKPLGLVWAESEYHAVKLVRKRSKLLNKEKMIAIATGLMKVGIY